jgi:hypothetical protein
MLLVFWFYLVKFGGKCEQFVNNRIFVSQKASQLCYINRGVFKRGDDRAKNVEEFEFSVGLML